jgi:NAD(P)H-hydrate epimerase
MQTLQETIPILSIDVPSGWDVNLGDVHGTGFVPSATISLTLPKKCMKLYHGIHYVGGRFMPPFLAEELQLRMPNYGDSVTQVPLLSTIVVYTVEESLTCRCS